MFPSSPQGWVHGVSCSPPTVEPPASKPAPPIEPPATTSVLPAEPTRKHHGARAVTTARIGAGYPSIVRVASSGSRKSAND